LHFITSHKMSAGFSLMVIDFLQGVRICSDWSNYDTVL